MSPRKAKGANPDALPPEVATAYCEEAVAALRWVAQLQVAGWTAKQSGKGRGLKVPVSEADFSLDALAFAERALLILAAGGNPRQLRDARLQVDGAASRHIAAVEAALHAGAVNWSDAFDRAALALSVDEREIRRSWALAWPQPGVRRIPPWEPLVPGRAATRKRGRRAPSD